MKPEGQTSVLVLSTISMIVSFAVWSVFAPIAVALQEIYHLSTTEKSILIATPVLLGSLMRIPMGILTDRYGGRRIYALTMLFLILPMVGAGFAHSYVMMLFWAFFIGMAGTTFAVSITYVSRLYPPQKQGLILGIAGMGNLGSAVASFLIPMIFTSYGMAWVFWSLAIAIGVMSITFWIGTQDSQRPSETKTLIESLSVLKFKETWFLSIFYFLTFGCFVTFSIYLPTLLHDLFHITALDAGIKTAGFVILATFIRPVGGYLSDRFGANKLLTVVFSGVLLCGLFIAFTKENFIFFSISCLIISILVGIGNGAVFKMVPEVSSGNTGAVTGIVGAVGGIGGFFPPIALGFLKDITGDYFLSFALLSILSLFCLIINHTGINKTRVNLSTKKIA
ncbi:NarK/NasA family nitrate transporter [Bacillus sp. ISL-40]|uniref:MFS transporter n=1 Tax=unclassified Bacillus (in: firmicutes) TaxID=185979 RepID=UPI001BE928BA|nr:MULTISPECIES: nitrate/nitrite transporter [unclassified Bacillus (in: firmicutes)]MBT2701311.1 NarK/NasA family nitrate transporter [Bacillus sp. ISL-40]MBT2724758.1 NarK/NasA family nitrate transporter [Bacillus sp. ISL-46]MBT2744589.1 NarK/NasA family nitrate transporter [Bacillus sp. ISL-77]